jgi:hypothetical protein
MPLSQTTACDGSLLTLSEIINAISDQLDDAYGRAIRIDEIILDRPEGGVDPAPLEPPVSGINKRLCMLLSKATRLNEATALVQSYLV